MATPLGTNNNIKSAAQQSILLVKALRKMCNLISEAKRNLRNELFDSVEAQHNCAVAERHCRTKLKRKLASAIEISQHNANTAFLAIFDKQRVNIGAW